MLLGTAFSVTGHAQPPLGEGSSGAISACQDLLLSAAWPVGCSHAQGCLADKLKGMFNSSSFLEGELEQVSFAL